MKSKKQLVTLVLLLAVSAIFSQNTNENRRRANRVEKAEKQVEETNKQIDSTIVGIDNTIEGAKATAKKVGEMFFGKKDKKKTSKKTSKNAIVISISSVSYDNENANQLYNEICKNKAAKNIVKTFSNGQLNIQMESKETADAIWQKVTQNTRTSFNINAISKNEIKLNLKK